MARGRLRPPMAEELSTPAWPPPSWLGPPRVSTASMVSVLPSMPMARGVLMLSPQLMLMLTMDMDMDMDMDTTMARGRLRLMLTTPMDMVSDMVMDMVMDTMDMDMDLDMATTTERGVLMPSPQLMLML